jgi:hypothetical protein
VRLTNITIAAAVVLPLVALFLWRAISGRVSPRRLHRFAHRQRLGLTDENRPVVSGYLTTTRRWRSAGLVLGLVAGTVATASEGLTLNSAALLAGWFVGAVIAELRLTPAEPGTVRAASLQPRLVQGRVGRGALAIPVALAGIALALGVALGLAQLTGQPVHGPRVLLDLGLAVVALLVPALVGRQVLDRRQPADLEPSIRQADDAIRDRSLLVLTGSAVALISFPACNLARELGRAIPSVHQPMFVLAVGLFLMPVVGWVLTGASGPQRAELDPVASRA